MNNTVHTESVPMDAETLEALRGSIAKWEGIVAGTIVDEGPTNCPLCKRFNKLFLGRQYTYPDMCTGCPVANFTGFPGCEGTPYDDLESLDPDDFESDADLDLRTRELQQQELKFLKSLLPQEPVTDESSVNHGD